MLKCLGPFRASRQYNMTPIALQQKCLEEFGCGLSFFSLGLMHGTRSYSAAAKIYLLVPALHDFRSSLTPPRPLLLLGTLALIEDHWVLSSVAGSSELLSPVCDRKRSPHLLAPNPRCSRSRLKNYSEIGFQGQSALGKLAFDDIQVYPF